MVPDYHMHTTLSKHASGSVAEFRDAAAAAGIPEICFTDHSANASGLGRSYTMEPESFPEYRRIVTELRDGREPEVLFGIEADYYPGCEAHLGKWLPAQGFDLVIGSVHYIGSWGLDNPEEMDGWKSADVPGVWRVYFGLIRDLCLTRLYDAVAHFDLPKKFGHIIPDTKLKEMVQPALDAVADADMAIEINTSGLRRTVKEMYPSETILPLARERGIPIFFGSDAHAPREVGWEFRKAVAFAKDTGYSASARYRNRARTMIDLP